MKHEFLSFGLVFILLSSFTPVCAQDLDSLSTDTPQVDIGGALRFNYVYSSWKEEQKTKGGEFGYDMFRIDFDASYKKVYLKAEYRIYSDAFGGGFLKRGWMGYRFNDNEEIQIGLTAVPFGIREYNSHNWFFNLTYYVGLEDDYDMGLKYFKKNEHWEYFIAFFKNAGELDFSGTNETSPNRYSYDVTGRNSEINQFNAKVVHKWGDSFRNRLGFSAQYGSLYNIDTKNVGNHHAFALHYELDWNNWNLKSEAMLVDHNPKNEEGQSDDVVQMGAYGTPYGVASNFNLYSLAVSKKIPVNWGPISALTLYNDFAMMDKNVDGFENSYMNVTGVMITAGQLLVYIDHASGYNHSWFGGNYTNDFSTGNAVDNWETRFNINFGYYF